MSVAFKILIFVSVAIVIIAAQELHRDVYVAEACRCCNRECVIAKLGRAACSNDRCICVTLSPFVNEIINTHCFDDLIKYDGKRRRYV